MAFSPCSESSLHAFLQSLHSPKISPLRTNGVSLVELKIHMETSHVGFCGVLKYGCLARYGVEALRPCGRVEQSKIFVYTVLEAFRRLFGKKRKCQEVGHMGTEHKKSLRSNALERRESSIFTSDVCACIWKSDEYCCMRRFENEKKQSVGTYVWPGEVDVSIITQLRYLP